MEIPYAAPAERDLLITRIAQERCQRHQALATRRSPSNRLFRIRSRTVRPLFRLDEEGGSTRERIEGRGGVVIASFPRGLAWIFLPFLAGRIPLEKDRHFFLGELLPVRPGIRFSDATAF